MFSLIITIVSIALVVALVAATMYHGGDTLTQGRTTADAAAFVSGAQQIGGAAVMHLSLVGTEAATVQALVDADYLASAPVVEGGAWSIDTATNTISSVVKSPEVCAQINKSAGVKAADTADADDTDAAPVATATEFANLAYGCVSASKTFQFKY